MVSDLIFVEKPPLTQRLFFAINALGCKASNRQRYKVVPLRRYDLGPSELSHPEGLADLFWREQPDHTVDLRRIGIRSTSATFFAH